MPSPPSIPALYIFFFLYLEPISTLIGAYYAHIDQAQYITLTTSRYSSSLPMPSIISPSTSVILSQLANLYFLFALNEGLVLRSTNDLRVWRTLLFGLLVADLGHLWSCREAAVAYAATHGAGGFLSDWALYWRFWEWNSMYWGNLGFVYVGATMRMCFLLGVGIGATRQSEASQAKADTKKVT